MTTAPSPTAILTEVAALAKSHGWAAAGEFTQSLPEPGSRGIAIVGPEDAGVGQLTAWITEPVASLSELEPLADNPARALTANRVLLVLRCGQLLTAGMVAAASTVLARPAGSYRVVLTGAEDLESAEDLSTVERGLWRVLLAPDGAEWRGQDIAARGCLLWSDADTADPLRDRVTADVAALREWLAGPVTAEQGLNRQQAAYAVSLALDELSGKPAAGTSQPAADQAALALEARRRADLAAQVHGLHTRLLARLDSDAQTTERQVLASLQVLEQDLARPASAGQAMGPDPARRRVELWVAETEQLLVQRYLSSSDEARHLLERGDWALVNQLAPHPGGDRYPGVLADPIAPQSTTVLPPGAIPTDIPGAPAATASGWNLPGGLGNVSPGVLITAAVGAAALGVLGTPLLPLAGATVLGVVGATLYERRRHAQQATGTTAATGSSSFASAGQLITGALAQHAAAVRAVVDAEFTTVEGTLDRVAESAREAAAAAPASNGAGPGDPLRSRLAALLEQLAVHGGTAARSESS